jgi:hypothetical protein
VKSTPYLLPNSPIQLSSTSTTPRCSPRPGCLPSTTSPQPGCLPSLVSPSWLHPLAGLLQPGCLPSMASRSLAISPRRHPDISIYVIVYLIGVINFHYFFPSIWATTERTLSVPTHQFFPVSASVSIFSCLEEHTRLCHERRKSLKISKIC